MKLRKLTKEDKQTFNKFLALDTHELSSYSFENIYIWKALFDIYWTVADDALCIFFEDRMGRFMYLPPLAGTIKKEIIERAFTVMNGRNSNRGVSRIENVEEKDVRSYKSLGYECREKGRDYICRRTDLSRLKGDRFKSKRASLNYFTKHYRFEYLPFSLKYKNECVSLYNEWAKGRGVKNADYIYRGMIEDNRTCLSTLLDNYNDLAFEGRIIRIGENLKGFTLGFRLNKDIFCVLYEITDLNVKGISQYIFQRFCAELTDYKYINIMDDSGLENLKKVKLSYHPAKLIPAYIVK